MRLGLVDLFKLEAEEVLDSGSLNLECLGVGNAKEGSGGSGRQKRPVSGSASGAADVRIEREKLAVPTKSLPDSLSRSTTEKLIE